MIDNRNVRPFFCSPCVIAALLVMVLGGMVRAESTREWHDSFFPYRVQIKLDKPASGQVKIDAPIDQLLATLNDVSLDIASVETFAFEKAILVDRSSGSVVGRFVLAGDGEPIDIDGSFLKPADSSPWQGLTHGTVDAVEGESYSALRVESDQIQNRSVKQPLKLDTQKLYLLKYKLWCEPDNSAMSISLDNPDKRIFTEYPHSYYPPMPPYGQWVDRAVLYAPDFPDTELRVVAGFQGKGAVAEVSFQPVRWVLLADLPAEVSELDLYVVFHAGHRLSMPGYGPLADVSAVGNVPVVSLESEAMDVNPDGVAIEGGEAMSAWTLPSYLPMMEETIQRTRPKNVTTSDNTKPVTVQLLRGESKTVVIAVDAGTPYANFSNVQSTLPLKVRIERIATIPVFDSFHPVGKKFQTRYDALVDVDFDQMPASGNGVQLLAVTVSADASTAAETHAGVISFSITNQEPATASFEFPVEVDVAPAVSKPTHHFATLFGGQQFTALYGHGELRPYYIRENTTIAEFHGYPLTGGGDDSMSRLSRPDRVEPDRTDIRKLAHKYYHRMFDFAVQPQSLMLFSTYTYDIQDNGPDRAPALSGWDFTEYDKTIDDLIIGRDAQWLTLWHMNGHSIDHFQLSNGITYTMRPQEPADGIQVLPRDEYLKLVADYFDVMAQYLHGKGCLDRTIIIIDESDPSTYENMQAVAEALRSREYARHIKLGHTSYHTAVYTKRGENGNLVLDDVLDVTIPDNDEHFNFYEPEYAARMTRPGKHSWVYYVESDHFTLHYAGLSTVVTPLKLRHMGVTGWYNWASFLWSWPQIDYDLMGFEYPNGPTLNPWLNPYNHHGPGVLSFFYPPDPRGPATEKTDRIIPSYRLSLMRDGIQDNARLAILQAKQDDNGQAIAADEAAAEKIDQSLRALWADSPVQWYLSYESYRTASEQLNKAFAQ